MIEFQINKNSNELVIIDGLVVTSGSVVHQGLKEIAGPKADSALQTLKRILGIRRKKLVVVEEEEGPVVELGSEDDDTDDEDLTDEESEDQEEVIDDSD
jgi:hypothetical protein